MEKFTKQKKSKKFFELISSTDVPISTEVNPISTKVKPYLGNWDEAPKFTQDNEYIRTGYRVNFCTIKRIIRSLFMIHNESVNIWSHLIGVILFLVFIAYIAICLSTSFYIANFDMIKEKFNAITVVKENSISQFYLFNVIGMKQTKNNGIWKQ